MSFFFILGRCDDKYKELDDNFATKDDAKVDEMNDKTEDLKTDSKGNKI